MIKLDYTNGKALHEQITQGIKDLIIHGVMAQNEQLPSVRDLSVSLTVNPNTIQRAYKNLETEGFIYSIRGKGNFVAKIPSADKKTISDLYDSLKETVCQLAVFGEEKGIVKTVIDNIYKELEEKK
jgi:GntR family transcriptional regulator